MEFTEQELKTLYLTLGREIRITQNAGKQLPHQCHLLMDYKLNELHQLRSRIDTILPPTRYLPKRGDFN